MLFLNQNRGNDLGYLYVAIVIILVVLSPAIILAIAGVILRKKKPKTAKICFIIAGVYLLVGLGICGSLNILS